LGCFGIFVELPPLCPARGADSRAQAAWQDRVTGCGPKGRFACFETARHAGTVIEISDVGGSRGRFFERVRAAAVDRDGSIR
jgi:hypothetical protein